MSVIIFETLIQYKRRGRETRPSSACYGGRTTANATKTCLNYLHCECVRAHRHTEPSQLSDVVTTASGLLSSGLPFLSPFSLSASLKSYERRRPSSPSHPSPFRHMARHRRPSRCPPPSPIVEREGEVQPRATHAKAKATAVNGSLFSVLFLYLRSMYVSVYIFCRAALTSP